jgi:hypothetical protein
VRSGVHWLLRNSVQHKILFGISRSFCLAGLGFLGTDATRRPIRHRDGSRDGSSGQPRDVNLRCDAPHLRFGPEPSLSISEIYFGMPVLLPLLIEVSDKPVPLDCRPRCNRARSESVVVGIFDNAQQLNRVAAAGFEDTVYDLGYSGRNSRITNVRRSSSGRSSPCDCPAIKGGIQI